MNYYSHKCGCGCNGQIEIKKYHKWYGIPKFIIGHHRNKRVKFILENRNKHFCYCGCGDQIEIKEHHLRYGIPKYISGHNTEIKVRLKCLYEKCANNVSKPYNKFCSHKCYSLYSVREKASAWEGGISKLPYAFEFNKQLKQFIKQRDQNICQNPNCMNTKNLHVHHIDYDKQNNNIENLVTLCRSCHTKTNHNRYYFTNYYQEILNAYL